MRCAVLVLSLCVCAQPEERLRLMRQRHHDDESSDDNDDELGIRGVEVVQVGSPFFLSFWANELAVHCWGGEAGWHGVAVVLLDGWDKGYGGVGVD